MALERKDEVLEKALSTDATVIPRFDVVLPNGLKVAENAQIVLKNPVLQEGMPINKEAMDECLAASGIAGGTKKNLTLAQPNYVLADGALIRFQLFDMLSGAATINVNNTGAKRIKTSAGEDPDGFVAGTWVDAIYSATRDQYILVGGGGGNAALSQSINLLEEVVDMKYCKVLTTQQTVVDLNAEWLSLGVLNATCETENYYWYMRIRQGSNLYEFRKVHKTTGVVEEFSGTSNFNWMTIISLPNGASYQHAPQAMKLQLTPVRNGDAVIWYAQAQYQYYNGSWYRYNYVAYGLVFPDNYVYVHDQQYNQGTNSYYDYGTHYFHSNTLNGYYDKTNKAIICALPFSLNPDQPYVGHYCTPCVLYCFNASTHAKTWQYTNGTSYGDSNSGKHVWVVNETLAVGFTVYRYNTNNAYYNQDVPYCHYMTFSASKAPTTYTAVGGNLSYPYGNLSTAYGFAFGWMYQPENSTISLICTGCSNASGSSSQRGSWVNMFTFNYSSKTASKPSYQVSSTVNQYQYACCLPGYVDKPVILMLTHTGQNTTSNSVAAVLYNLDTKETQSFPECGTSCVNNTARYNMTGSNINYNWGDILGPGMISASITGSVGRIADPSGRISVVDLNPSNEGLITEWVCPEDGIYKFIAVGGGAEGAATYGGGAGYLQIATAQLVAGDILCCKLGTGGVIVQSSAYDIVRVKSKAQATYAYLKNNPAAEPIILAMPATGNQGGATGAATASGGGAGGFDLVQYGGQGMNFCSTGSTTVSVTSSSQTISVGNIALSKDRNGGVSANAGACTSGDGYGAGGGMNQDGKDGCLVIIR